MNEAMYMLVMAMINGYGCMPLIDRAKGLCMYMYVYVCIRVSDTAMSLQEFLYIYAC